MSGTIAVVAGDTGRFTNFTTSLSNVQKPPGTEINVLVGSDRIQGRNAQVEQMKGDWLWFIDDDHEFPPNTLMRLLEHQVDVIVPLCLMRAAPFNPVDYVGMEGELLMPIDLTQAKHAGTTELFAAGTSGMLIRRRVFDEFRKRWPGAPIFEHEAKRSEDIIFCLPPGAWVDGNQTCRIEDVRVGDHVVTHSGSLHRVRDLSERFYKGDLVSITPTYGDPLRMTPRHRLLVSRDGYRQWLEAGELQEGDYLCVPKPPWSENPINAWDVSDLIPGLELDAGMVGYARTRKSALKISERIQATPSLARLLGYFISEGTLDPRQQNVTFCLGAHEHEYIRDLCEILEGEFGAKGFVSTRSGCTRVTVSSAVLSRLLVNLCDGHRAVNKRLPVGWRGFDRETISQLITGYWRGDGSYDSANGFRMTTCSPRLAADLRSSLLRLGIYAGIRYRSNGSAGRFDLFIPHPETRKFASLVGENVASHLRMSSYLREDDDRFYVRVQSVQHETYEGLVYNLSVEDDESYTANGFAVHNCERLRELGIKIHLDLGARIGHLSVVAVYPDDRTPDGRWAIGMRVGQNFPIQIGIEGAQ